MTQLGRVSRVVHVRIRPEETSLLLVLQHGGDKIAQKDGSEYMTMRDWKPPGGKEKGNEGSRSTAKREYLEETGTPLPSGQLKRKCFCVDSSPSTRLGQPALTATYTYLAIDAGPKGPAPRCLPFTSKEIEAVRWFPVQELPIHRSVYGAYGAKLGGKNLQRIVRLVREYRHVLQEAGVKPQDIEKLLSYA